MSASICIFLTQKHEDYEHASGPSMEKCGLDRTSDSGGEIKDKVLFLTSCQIRCAFFCVNASGQGTQMQQRDGRLSLGSGDRRLSQSQALKTSKCKQLRWWSHTSLQGTETGSVCVVERNSCCFPWRVGQGPERPYGIDQIFHLTVCFRESSERDPGLVMMLSENGCIFRSCVYLQWCEVFSESLYTILHVSMWPVGERLQMCDCTGSGGLICSFSKSSAKRRLFLC